MNKLEQWQEKYQKAKSSWSRTKEELLKYSALYEGTYEIETTDPTLKGKVKKAKSVRNIIAENIDTIVDSNIPTPKVTAKREQDEKKADRIENFLRNELDRLPFETLNDEDERTTSIFGADIFLVEWNNNGGTHTTVGEIEVSLVDPTHFIPQANVKDIKKADYIFFEVQMTKEQIKDKFNVDVSDQVNEDDDELMVIMAYYRNRKDDCIGRYCWVNDKELEDIPDYFARILNVCKKCGQVTYEKECKYCGSKAIERKRQDYEELYQPIVDENGEIKRPDRQVVYEIDSMGNTIEQERPMRVDYYKINQFPIAFRKNISVNNKLLGESDVKRMKDQQNAIKKHETKMMEKLEAAGSIFTKPKGLKMTTNNEEMRIIEIEKPEQMGMIQTINLQADVTQDLQYIEYNYQASRYALGVTDSFQGRKDTTATSGKAKEFAASQTAGRLESKKVMKNACYADLFELMFKFMLAFADEPRSIVAKDKDGKVEYLEFNKYDFLEVDEAGEIYWNDEFLFSVDSAAALANNREAMWQETRMNLDTGAMGNPQEISTLIRFWTIMESLHYPKATQIKQQLQEQQEQEAQMQQLQAQNQQLQQQLQAQNEQLGEANKILEQANSEQAMYDKRVRDLDLAERELELKQRINGGIL